MLLILSTKEDKKISVYLDGGRYSRFDSVYKLGSGFKDGPRSVCSSPIRPAKDVALASFMF